MDVVWTDADLESFSADYDAVRLTLRQATGEVVVVEGQGPLGFELAGLWDETIIERAELRAEDDFETRCWRAVQMRLGDNVPESGSPARNARSFTTLVITLIDGAELRVTAASFTASR